MELDGPGGNIKNGINNPLEIKRPEGYDELLAYWSGKANKPSETSAWKVLQELLQNIKIEENIYHPDVVDAMIRQVQFNTAKPFKQHFIGKTGYRLNAVDYDMGPQQIAYYDTDTARYQYTPGVNTEGNKGYAYRNDGVDIQKTENGYCIFNIEDNEWLQYTVTAEEAGEYSLIVFAAAEKTGSILTVAVADKRIKDELEIPVTIGMHQWQAVPAGNIYLHKGDNIIRLIAIKGGFNLDHIQFTKKIIDPLKGILALCGLFLSGALFAQRTLININTGWKFSKGQSAEAVSKWDNINLPHTWNINDVMDDIPGYYRGQGLYKRRMFIDAENKGQQLYLVFEGANQIAEIFINGKKAGRHIGGYAAFYVPITSLVRYGEQNELMVKVDNSHDQHIPPLSADFTFYGGIYRDAWLLKTNAIHFSSKENTKGIYISTPVVEEKKAVVHIKSIIDNDAVFSKRFKVVQTIRNKKGDIVGAASQKAVINPSETITDEQDIIILDPILWRPEFPYLYQLVTELRDEVTGSLLDKIQQPIGLRSFYFEAQKRLISN